MNDFVTIATFDDYFRANFQKQKLEENGIDCYLADENTITIQWTLANAMGGIKLRVPAEDAEKAILILNEKQEEVPVDFTIPDSDLTCPNCGSNNAITERYSKQIAGVSWLIFGFPITANPTHISRCFYCGHIWKE